MFRHQDMRAPCPISRPFFQGWPEDWSGWTAIMELAAPESRVRRVPLRESLQQCGASSHWMIPEMVTQLGFPPAGTGLPTSMRGAPAPVLMLNTVTLSDAVAEFAA